ncbi:MAG: HAMP domain-containing sensor histidine kinase [Hyphomonadaceae bacterium]
MRRNLNAHLHLPTESPLTNLEYHALTIGSAAALVFLAGWGIGLSGLRDVVPGLPTMKPATALSLMALALACLLSLRTSRGAERAALLISVLVLAVSTFYLLVGAREASWPEWLRAPSTGTSLCLILAASAYILMIVWPERPRLTGFLAMLGLALPCYRLCVLTFDAQRQFVLTGTFGSMALHTAFLLAWLQAACVFLHPRLPYGAAILEPSLRGRMLRRALPFMVMMPVISVAAGLAFAQTHTRAADAALALITTVAMLVGGALVWRLGELIGEWQTEANEQAAHLARANEALEHFASAAAHDLKAPVRHVLIYAELLQDAVESGRPDLAAKYVRRITEGAADLPRQVEAMLTFARSAHKSVHMSDCYLSEVLRSAIRNIQPQIERRRANVRLLKDIHIVCDSALVATVFQNLVANSLRHARDDLPLAVRIDAEATSEHWRIVFEDNGAGFDPEIAATVFDPLTRPGASQAAGGGIGLATCRKIILAHGGDIHVDSSFRRGARIVFTLKRRKVDRRDPGREQASEPQSLRARRMARVSAGATEAKNLG